MANFSFDIVSDYDKAEVANAFDQTKREINSRYDFKGTPAAIDWIGADKTGMKIIGNSEYMIDAITDLFRKKLASRGESQKILDTSAPNLESNLKTTKDIGLKSGLDKDKAKEITRLIQNAKLKVKSTIQGDLIRVTGSSKNDLQEVISLLKGQDFDYPLRFINYR